DDDENILKQLRWALESDYQVFTSSMEGEALSVFEREKPPVVILDLSLNPHNSADLGGMRLLDQILSDEPMTRVIVITGMEDDQNALCAVRLGAFDYYPKPVKLDELKVMIQRAFHIYSLQQRVNQNEHITSNGFYGMVGISKCMKDIFRFIDRVSVSDISVLICGESGTGKEVVAQAIHAHSQRKHNPFVVVNCGAIPDNLLENELFGHEKGAFTGAHAQKRGKFELAHTGTLFLDEIGELAPPLQIKLLRFLQDRKIERLGATQPIELDVRIIAATNRDLKKDMENRLFREDLYYRLKVVPLQMPPLRERKEDILPLALYFLKKTCKEHRKPPIALSPEAEGALLMYRWPGNVRELEHLISRSVVLSSRAILKPSDLGFALDQIPTEVNLKFAKKAIEMDFVKKALHRNSGIVSRAARELGISRVNLYDLLEKYNIRPQDFKVMRAPSKNAVRTWEIS
ncbi:MAG: PEP-CTERM-box response regulator transcription factor, partial [Candidatus Binatia bacterium]